MHNQHNVLLYIIGRHATAETYDYLHNLLPASKQLAYRVVIVNQTTPFPPELHVIATQHDDVEIITLDIPTTASWLLRIRTLIAYLHELQPTVVHLLTHTTETDRDCQIAMWLVQTPLHRVISIATITPPHQTTGMLSSIDRLIGQRALQAMQTIIVPSSPIKQYIQSYYRLTSTSIEVIPIGIDSTHYALYQINYQTRADYHLPAQGAIIAAIGTFTQRKGHALLIHAMRNVWQQYPDTHLVLVGDGPEFTNLQLLAQQSQQPSYIHFLAPLSDERYFLALIDIYVHPSLHEEMSFHLLNAMALERPVVASAIPNVQEVIEANASGLLIRPYDADAIASAIMRLFNDHELRITMAINARTRISQRFQATQWHQRTVDCYRIHSTPPYRV
jgi:glycosyltransferase involved in cell wall biosynthesis